MSIPRLLPIPLLRRNSALLSSLRKTEPNLRTSEQKRHTIDEHDAHGAAVVGGGDGAKPLLARRVPYLQLDLLPVHLDRADLEVDPCVIAPKNGKATSARESARRNLAIANRRASF